MLFDARTLDGIASGRITVTFRRWSAPRAKAGSSQLTRIGRVGFGSIQRVNPNRISAADVRAAGFADRASLLARTDGKDRADLDLYRIELRLLGEDPRVALRAEDQLDDAALAGLSATLDRMDRAAPQPWTRSVLELIADQPGVVARELAAQRGEERDFFKIRVRRLKALGLTESLPVGYLLSPRGQAFLDRTG